MPKFVPYNYNQTSMVVINYEEQLQAGTFEHAVHHLIDKKWIFLFFILTTKMILSQASSCLWSLYFIEDSFICLL